MSATKVTHFSGLALGEIAGVKGTGISYLEMGTVSVDPGSLTTGAEADTSITIANAATGDLVILNPPTAGLTAGIEMCGTWVSAASTVKVRLRNNTAGTIDEAAGNWTYLLIKNT